VAEAGWFADKLNESGLAVEGLVVNRVHPSFGDVGGLPAAPPGSDLAALVANFRDQQQVHDREQATLERIVTEVAPSPVVQVPLLDFDVHDVDGLREVAGCIFGGAEAVVAGGGTGLP
jgi:anion-transporting  ArsA/GET3 family ATPase